MTVADAVSMDRVAQPLVVDMKVPRGSGESYPAYPDAWTDLYVAAPQRIEINMGARPSVARILLASQRWDTRSWGRYLGLPMGTMVRIRTLDDSPSILFQGFVTGHDSSFTGGSGAGGRFSPAHEADVAVCRDYRWLLAAASPLLGQYVRGPNDYLDYGAEYEFALDDQATWLIGRRIIFNEAGRPNKDPLNLNLTVTWNASIPIFAPPTSSGVEYWTAREMIWYCLSPLYNKAYDYLPIDGYSDLPGLADSDFDAVVSNVAVDGLNALEAVDLICRHIGWSFREQYDSGGPSIVFFKPGDAAGYSRSSTRRTVVHNLHAPAVGEVINAAVAEGRKMLWSMAIKDDISNLVNRPRGVGAPDRFEFTAELVPAWRHSDLFADASESYANLFFADSDLQTMTDPNSRPYYRYHHVRGADFRRNVGRQWSLNETGRYSLSPLYLGAPFDFATVIPASYIFNGHGKRDFARFARRLLPCLTQDKESLNSVGIVVEFSFDHGSTWQAIPCSIRSLPDECGIYIAEPNLCEMVDSHESNISGGVLDGVQLNYFSSLADDRLNGRVFSAGQWRTRVRVTASVQMDKRITHEAARTSRYSSPFSHRRVYDYSDKYGFAARTFASAFDGSAMPADEYDFSAVMAGQIEMLRDAYQDASLSGLFVLERLWLGEGAGQVDFLVGDGIEGVSGRAFPLSGRIENRSVYPEIVQIVYLPAEQKMQLITRDLRFAEVTL